MANPGLAPVACTCRSWVAVGATPIVSGLPLPPETVAVALPAPSAASIAVWSAACSAAAPPAPDQSAPATVTVANAPLSRLTSNCRLPGRALVLARDRERPADRAVQLVHLVAQRRRDGVELREVVRDRPVDRVELTAGLARRDRRRRAVVRPAEHRGRTRGVDGERVARCPPARARCRSTSR